MDTMNPAVTLEQVGMLRKNDNSLAFLTASAKRSANELSGSATQVLVQIREALTQLLVNMIERRTAEEFRTAFDIAFPTYVSLTAAASKYVAAVVPPPVTEGLIRESLCEMEAEFRNEAAASFGTPVRDQAIFTVWTVRKIADLLIQIAASPVVEESKRAHDKTCSDNFVYHALRANFGIQCLLVALSRKTAVYPEVLDQLIDCLRSAVNAYAWIRQGVELRSPSAEGPQQTVAWDDEDDQLLAAAMQDLGDLADESL